MQVNKPYRQDFIKHTQRYAIIICEIMPEGDYQPRPLEAPPTDRGGDASQGEPQSTFIDTTKALMEGKQLKFKTPIKAYDMLLDLTVEAGMYDDMPDSVVDSLHNVSIAYGILAYKQLPDTIKELFLMRLDRHRENYLTEQLELSQEEALMLQTVAQAVNIDYDPGTEQTPEKRIFPFSQAEQHPPEYVSSYFTTLTTDRSMSPESPTIVDSNPAPINEEWYKDW